MDIINIMRPHGEYTATGRFYKTRPLNHNAGGASFYFAYVEPKSKTYARIFANVTGADENIAIRTVAELPFKAGESCVRLPDGALYTVVQVMSDYSRAPQQALRMFKNPSGVEKILRLKRYEDGWEA